LEASFLKSPGINPEEKDVPVGVQSVSYQSVLFDFLEQAMREGKHSQVEERFGFALAVCAMKKGRNIERAKGALSQGYRTFASRWRGLSSSAVRQRHIAIGRVQRLTELGECLEVKDCHHHTPTPKPNLILNPLL